MTDSTHPPPATRARPWRIAAIALRVIAIALGAASAWLPRGAVNPDGISYLDVSDVYLRGGWPEAQTGYWSPGYPTLLAIARLIGGTAPEREVGVAHALNFVIFLFAFAALEWLLRSIRATLDDPDDERFLAWRVLAYALFAWTTVEWITVWVLTPDVAVAGIAFAATALGVRIAAGRGGVGSWLTLGVLLAVGYLVKAVLLPFGVVVLVTLAVALRHRRGFPRAALAGAVFVAICAPQIIYVSRLKGAPTASDVGRLTYAWYVAGVPGPVSSALPLPATLPEPTTTPKTLAMLDPAGDPRPAVYAVGAPIPGTFPLWYDAGYWYRGVRAGLHPVATIRAVVRHTRAYLEMLAFLIIGGLAAVLASGVTRQRVAAMRPSAVLVLPALALLGLYALLLVQSRYVAPFVVLLVLGLVTPHARDELTRRLRLGFVVGALCALPFTAFEVRRAAAHWDGAAEARAAIARDLRARGVESGTRVAFIGEAHDAAWARHARLRIVSVVPRQEAGWFWASDSTRRAAVLDTMRAHGATTVIAEAPSAGVDVRGWIPLGPPGSGSGDRPGLLLHSSTLVLVRH